MRVVVTGAAGFLGRSVSSRLEEQGNEVIRVARTPGNLRASERASALYLDLRRPDVFKHSLPSNLDTIVHLAAAIPTSFTGTDANNAAQANIAIDRNVFLACRDLGVATIYASGTSVYGLGNSGPHVESAPTSAVGPYVAAKIAGEHAGKELLQARGIPFTVLRISAPYGPGQQARTVLRLFIERGLQDLPLQYHGTGSRQQDFTYVADVVDAVAKACRIQPRGIYNIASGREP